MSYSVPRPAAQSGASKAAHAGEHDSTPSLRKESTGYLAVANAIVAGGPGLVRLAIRYAHQWQVTDASAELLYLGQGLIGIGGFQAEALATVTELATSALAQGAATLDLTTEHPGVTRTVQRLKFTGERGTEVVQCYSVTGRGEGEEL